MTDHRATPHPRSTLLAALAVAAALLVVPASLPLCAMDVEACAVDVPVAPAGSHCPMDAAGLGEMECCLSDATSEAPAVPSKSDAERQLQLQSLALPAPAGVDLASAPTAPVTPEAPDLAASPVPLYTLLSSLLS